MSPYLVQTEQKVIWCLWVFHPPSDKTLTQEIEASINAYVKRIRKQPNIVFVSHHIDENNIPHIEGIHISRSALTKPGWVEVGHTDDVGDSITYGPSNKNDHPTVDENVDGLIDKPCDDMPAKPSKKALF